MADSADAFIETGIDRLLTYLRKEGRVQSVEAAASLDVDEDTVLNWARALQKSGMVTVTYSARDGKIIQLEDAAATDKSGGGTDSTAAGKNARVRRLEREEAKIERYVEVIKRFRHQLDRDESFAQDLREALSTDDDETIDTYLTDLQQLEGELEGVLQDIDHIKDDIDDLETLAEQIDATTTETASPGLFARFIGKLRPGHRTHPAEQQAAVQDADADESDQALDDTAAETLPAPEDRPRTTLPHSMDPDVEEPSHSATRSHADTAPTPRNEQTMDIEAELAEDSDSKDEDVGDERSAHPHLAAAASSFRNLLGSDDDDEAAPSPEDVADPEPEPPREDAPAIDTVLEQTIPEVRADVIHYRLNPETVLEAEQAGKDRKTLKSWLRDEMGDAE